MPVHTISSDLHRGNVERYAVSLARTMTKLRALGLSLIDAVRAVTLAPAQAVALTRHGFGRLAIGEPAYATVFEEVDQPVELEDAEGTRRTAARPIRTRGVAIGSAYWERSATL